MTTSVRAAKKSFPRIRESVQKAGIEIGGRIAVGAILWRRGSSLL
jgi:hypothetical protein